MQTDTSFNRIKSQFLNQSFPQLWWWSVSLAKRTEWIIIGSFSSRARTDEQCHIEAAQPGICRGILCGIRITLFAVSTAGWWSPCMQFSSLQQGCLMWLTGIMRDGKVICVCASWGKRSCQAGASSGQRGMKAGEWSARSRSANVQMFLYQDGKEAFSFFDRNAEI